MDARMQQLKGNYLADGIKYNQLTANHLANARASINIRCDQNRTPVRTHSYWTPLDEFLHKNVLAAVVLMIQIELDKGLPDGDWNLLSHMVEETLTYYVTVHLADHRH